MAGPVNMFYFDIPAKYSSWDANVIDILIAKHKSQLKKTYCECKVDKLFIIIEIIPSDVLSS